MLELSPPLPILLLLRVDRLKEAITNLKRAMHKNSEDEFQQVANHIAAQSRQLPLQNALLLQEKIQSLITRENFMHDIPFTSARSDSPRCHISITINIVE
jgi:hypothetical protein